MKSKTSARLKQLRNEMQLTQASLAKKLGVARMTIVNYENGKSVPETDFLMKASSYFGCTVDFLLGVSDSRNVETLSNMLTNLDLLSDQLSNMDESTKRSFLIIFNGVIATISVTNQEIENGYDEHAFLDLMQMYLSMLNTGYGAILDPFTNADDTSERDKRDVILKRIYDTLDYKNKTINLIEKHCNKLLRLIYEKYGDGEPLEMFQDENKQG